MGGLARLGLPALFVLSFFSGGATSCNSVPVDTGISPFEAKDVTALIQGDGKAPHVEGCDKTLQSGYTHCRVREGAVADSAIYLVAPVTSCTKDDGICRFFDIYNQKGEIVKGGHFAKDETRVEIKWKDLLGRDTFEKADRGFWIYVYEWYWLNPDGQEMKTVVDGEIRMRVYSKDYKPLRDVSSNPNFVYDWVENGVEVKSTSSGRTYVGAQ